MQIKIYGHVVVPEGVEAKPRDAWTGEVEVTLRITYADTTKSSVEITALTQGQTDENEGQDITHGEKANKAACSKFKYPMMRD